ncbi:MAG: hypothetical protein AAGB05_05110 [Pseudomonadota bacterium]
MSDIDVAILRRPDGSIDTGHYMARGRRLRAEQARRLTSPTSPADARPRLSRRKLFSWF